jgi:cobalamin synthase
MPLSLFSLLDADPVEPFTQFMESYAYSGPIIGLLTGVFAVKLFVAARPGFACILIWLATFTWLLGSVLGTYHAEGLAMAADCQTV